MDVAQETAPPDELPLAELTRLARAEAHQLRVESLLGEAIALAQRLDGAIG